MLYRSRRRRVRPSHGLSSGHKNSAATSKLIEQLTCESLSTRAARSACATPRIMGIAGPGGPDAIQASRRRCRLCSVRCASNRLPRRPGRRCAAWRVAARSAGRQPLDLSHDGLGGTHAPRSLHRRGESLRTDRRRSRGAAGAHRGGGLVGARCDRERGGAALLRAGRRTGGRIQPFRGGAGVPRGAGGRSRLRALLLGRGLCAGSEHQRPDGPGEQSARDRSRATGGGEGIDRARAGADSGAAHTLLR